MTGEAATNYRETVESQEKEKDVWERLGTKIFNPNRMDN